MLEQLFHPSHVQFGRTALISAARLGHTATVRYLVTKTSSQVNATSNVSHGNYGASSRNSRFVPIQYYMLHYNCIKSS